MKNVSLCARYLMNCCFAFKFQVVVHWVINSNDLINFWEECIKNKMAIGGHSEK